MSGATGLRAAYSRLPEDVRHCLRPLNFVDEAASFLPSGVGDRIAALTSRARRLRLAGRARYAVRRLDGIAAGSAVPLAVRLVADEPSSRWWTRTLFAEPPHETRHGTLFARDVAADAAAGGADAGVDLAVWQLSWPIRQGRVAGDVVPSWTPLWLATDRALDDIVRGERSGRAARKNDVRRVLKLGLVPRVTTEPEAVERFRRELYEPYVRTRFGDDVVVLTRHAFRQARRNGCLLLLERDGEPRAGALLERKGEAFCVRAFGAVVEDGQAAIEACYYHAIALAVERRVARIELGTARPVLTDGVLRYKRKWGARLGSPTTLDRFLVRHRNGAPLRAALTASPLVVERGGGRLAALAAAQGVDATEQLARIDVPGLDEIVLLLEPAAAAPPAAPWSPVRGVAASGG
jgi:hypothetical protein